MRFFSEATLLKMETSFTRLRKEIEDAPTFWQTCQYPTLLLKPNQDYRRSDYVKASIVSTVALTLLVCLTQVVVFVASAFVLRQLWSAMLAPQNHAALIGGLSRAGVYYLPFVPIAWLLFSLAELAALSLLEQTCEAAATRRVH